LDGETGEKRLLPSGCDAGYGLTQGDFFFSKYAFNAGIPGTFFGVINLNLMTTRSIVWGTLCGANSMGKQKEPRFGLQTFEISTHTTTT
jgi:hypothetical protein